MEDGRITFKGVDGAECEHFIHEIRRKARAANRSKDNDWIIELVSACVVGSALRWYIRLDSDVAEDWAKLQKAMIDKWPGEEDGGEVESSSLPTPAAAPEPTPASASDTIGLMASLSLNTTKTGYIRVNSPGSGGLFISATFYNINDTEKVAFGTCADRPQAMIVQFTPGCVHIPVSFVIQNSQSNLKYLAIAQIGNEALGQGSTEHAVLVPDNDQGPIGSSYDAARIRTMVWSVCPVDNSIQALWSAEGSNYRLTAVIGSIKGRVGFVSNASAFRAHYARPGLTYADADLTFEEI